jgi:hypothetical protein
VLLNHLAFTLRLPIHTTPKINLSTLKTNQLTPDSRNMEMPHPLQA